MTITNKTTPTPYRIKTNIIVKEKFEKPGKTTKYIKKSPTDTKIVF